MSSSRIERKLAAIMFTDIAGYTALSAKDETKALKLLDIQKQILTPIIEEFNGTLHKEMGDGLLFTFPTVTEAVKCGIKIQEDTIANADLNLRIGIHEGEITLKDGDALGDDVNVASRIEAFAPSGGIAISSKVQQNISSLPEFETSYMGKPELKGVSQEVKVYCITSHGLPKADEIVEPITEESKSNFNIFALTGGILTAIGVAFWIAVGVFDVSFGGKTEVPSIGILMMDNIGGEDDEFWARGITEDLIVKIAGAGLIRVAPMEEIIRISDLSLAIKEKAKTLDVKYLLTSSLHKKDDQFDLRCQLIEAESGNSKYANKWSESIDKTPTIVGNLAENILKTLKVSTKQDIVKAPTTNAEAYQYYLMGRYKYKKQNNDGDISVAKELLRKAIELDDDLIDAKVWLGKIYQDEKNNNKALSIFEKSLKKSRILGDSIGVAGSLIGIGDIQFSLGKIDSAIMCYKQAIEIEGEIGDKRGIARLKISSCGGNSVFDDLESQIDYYQESLVIAKEMGDSSEIAYTLMQLGNTDNRSMPEEAINYYNQALAIYEKLDDIDNVIWAVRNIGLVYDNIDDFDKALNYYEQALGIAEENEHNNWIINITMDLGRIYEDKGNEDKALNYYEQALGMAEENEHNAWIRTILMNIGWKCYFSGYYSKALDYFNRELRIIEELGDSWFKSNNLTNIGLVYFQQEDYNKAVEYLDKSATMQMERNSTINLETASYLFLSKEILGKEYNVAEIHKLIREEEEIKDYINFALFKLLEDTSYLETAYTQVQEKASAMDDGNKFLSYPIPSAIVEEWEKVK